MRRKIQKTPSLMLLTALVLASTCSVAQGARSAGAPQTEAKSASSQLSDTPTREPEAVVSGAITLESHSAGTLGRALAFKGTAPSASSGETAAIERYEAASGSWSLLGDAPISPQGSFVVHWDASLAGQLTVRAAIVPSGQLSATGVATATGGTGATPATPAEEPASDKISGSAQITVFRPALATYYGPGLYGNQTACGQVLNTSIIGVANRKLPCGTLVAVSYDHERLTVPVIDRGPYGDAANWDLTSGAAAALGMTGTARIGTLVVGKMANMPTLGMPKGARGEAPAGAEGAPEVGVTGGATAG